MNSIKSLFTLIVLVFASQFAFSQSNATAKSSEKPEMTREMKQQKKAEHQARRAEKAGNQATKTAEKADRKVQKADQKTMRASGKMEKKASGKQGEKKLPKERVSKSRQHKNTEVEQD